MADRSKDYIRFMEKVKNIADSQNGVPLFDTPEGRAIFDEFERLSYDSKMVIVYRGIGCYSRENELGNTICPIFNKHERDVNGRRIERNQEIITQPPPTPVNPLESELIKTRFWIFKTVFILTILGLIAMLTFIAFFLIRVTIEDGNVMDGFSKIFKIIFQ